MDQDVLGFGVELDGLPIDCLLERMPDQRLVLVVLDTYGVQPLLAPLVRPCQQASHPVLGPLKPFEADHRHCCRLGPGFRNAPQAPGEFMDLLARHRVFLTFRTAIEREVVPRVRVFFVKQLRMQPAHNAPDLAAEPDHLLALPQPESARAVDYPLIDLVDGPWCDLSNLPVADAPALLRRDNGRSAGGRSGTIQHRRQR
jgi:hypothetical protein